MLNASMSMFQTNLFHSLNRLKKKHPSTSLYIGYSKAPKITHILTSLGCRERPSFFHPLTSPLHGQELEHNEQCHHFAHQKVAVPPMSTTSETSVFFCRWSWPQVEGRDDVQLEVGGGVWDDSCGCIYGWGWKFGGLVGVMFDLVSKKCLK